MSKVQSMEKARQKKQAESGIQATLGELLLASSQGPVPGALETLSSQRMPITVSFRFGKILKAVNAEIEAYNVELKKLGERYANKDSEGKPIVVDKAGSPVAEGQSGTYDIEPDKAEEAAKELMELQAANVTIPGEQLKIGDLSGVTIAPEHTLALGWLITEGEVERA